jgi:hypothetical protein
MKGPGLHTSLPRITVLLLALVTSIASWQLPPLDSAVGPPTPSGLSAAQDDRNAILRWDFDPQNPAAPLPAGVTGYKITWGPASNPAAFSKLTEERVIQLQPLVNGQPYVAQVQSVNSLGQLSAPSAAIQFTGDSARVDALRARMNGFFDDFNLPQGLPDERKWNAAYSRCNGDWSNGFFINDQFHAHNTVFTDNCDRGQSISRPRAELDFSDNGTRTIVFDFDGEFRRNQWYLDIVPRLMDISGQVNIEGLPGVADPANGVRFRQNDQVADISVFDASGQVVTPPDVANPDGAHLDALGLKQVPNVRRHWEIHISRTAAEVLIDGKRVAATAPGAFHLTQNRYTVLWNVFAYNSNKANVPFVLAHWDNFGFDAPAGTAHTTVTHNYRLYTTGTDFTKAYGDSAPAVKQLNIPDPVSGSIARRLMFTIQMDTNDWYDWSPSDAVTVNGTKLAIPKPASNAQPAIPLQTLVSTISPYSVVLQLPDGVLHQGQNSISFNTAASSVHNIHAELDFSSASEPAYTPPAQAIGGPAQPQIRPVGPNAFIAKIGTAVVDNSLSDLTTLAVFNPTVSGIVPVGVEAHNDIAMQSTGSNNGIKQIDLLIDGNVVASQRTDAGAPAPGVSTSFSLDTRKLSNGEHEIYVRAYDARCFPSIADYGDIFGTSGTYYPLHINVRNGAAAAAPATLAVAPAATYRTWIPITISGRLIASTCAPAAAAAASVPGGSTKLATYVPRDLWRDERQLFICE